MASQTGNYRNREHTPQFGNGRQGDSGERLANGLGWFSIGLGLAELTAPAALGHLIGVGERGRSRTVLRTYGVREIAAGMGILSSSRPSGWLWGRVAGDALDLASLGSAMIARDSNRTRVAASIAAVLGVAALDVICAQELSRDTGRDRSKPKPDGKVRVIKTIIVDRSPEEIYQFWRNLSNLPSFMKHLESVQETGGKTSHWTARTAGGRTVEWDAEMTQDEADKQIAWRSLDGSDLENSGAVRFERATGGRGTLVRVDLRYAPPGGAVAAKVAKLFRAEPGQQVEDDLRGFKQILETGEIVRSDASIHRGMHAAQPPKTVAATA